jgi:hypothetical protein
MNHNLPDMVHTNTHLENSSEISHVNYMRKSISEMKTLETKSATHANKPRSLSS